MYSDPGPTLLHNLIYNNNIKYDRDETNVTICSDVKECPCLTIQAEGLSTFPDDQSRSHVAGVRFSVTLPTNVTSKSWPSTDVSYGAIKEESAVNMCGHQDHGSESQTIIIKPEDTLSLPNMHQKMENDVDSSQTSDKSDRRTGLFTFQSSSPGPDSCDQGNGLFTMQSSSQDLEGWDQDNGWFTSQSSSQMPEDSDPGNGLLSIQRNFGHLAITDT
jgi:hypothetical protein